MAILHTQFTHTLKMSTILLTALLMCASADAYAAPQLGPNLTLCQSIADQIKETRQTIWEKEMELQDMQSLDAMGKLYDPTIIPRLNYELTQLRVQLGDLWDQFNNNNCPDSMAPPSDPIPVTPPGAN